MPTPRHLALALLMAAALLVLASAAESLRWRLEHDTPLLHYAAYLMLEHGLIPYRDIFETSFPGTFAMHGAFVAAFGSSDVAARTVDVVLYLLLAATMTIASRPIHPLVGLTGAVLFGLGYFALGQGTSLQRDYLGVLPIVAAFLLARCPQALALGWRAAGVGALGASAALVKPHLAAALPWVLIVVVAGASSAMTRRHAVVICAAGAASAFVAVCAVAALILTVLGALPAFAEMVSAYLPLHLRLSGEFQTLFGQDRIVYLWRGMWRFGGDPFALWSLLGVAGFFVWRSLAGGTAQARVIGHCLAGTALTYALTPVLGGKFWGYHYLPCLLFACWCAALALVPVLTSVGRRGRDYVIVFAALALVWLTANIPRQLDRLSLALRSNAAELYAPRDGRVDALAAWLERHTRPGDAIQPLDWTGVALHALLIARRPLATRYLYDYHFHHHLSSPVIQRLREDFLTRLASRPPPFVIDVYDFRPVIWGPDTDADFAPLRQWLSRGYRLVEQRDGYRIWARKVDLQ